MPFKNFKIVHAKKLKRWNFKKKMLNYGISIRCDLNNVALRVD